MLRAEIKYLHQQEEHLMVSIMLHKQCYDAAKYADGENSGCEGKSNSDNHRYSRGTDTSDHAACQTVAGGTKPAAAVG